MDIAPHWIPTPTIYNPHFIRVGIPSDKPAKLFFSFANPVENAGKQFSKDLKSGGGIIHQLNWPRF